MLVQNMHSCAPRTTSRCSTRVLHTRVSVRSVVAPQHQTPPTTLANTPRKLVTIDYAQLTDGKTDLCAQIEEAYGPDGLGILTVANVPGYTERRTRLLTCISQLAALPPDVLAKYEDPQSAYSYGWSHGKEMLRSGVADTLKGSFYANPVLDDPLPHDTPNKAQLQAAHPALYRPNIWPREELPEFEFAFKELGRLIVDVGALITAQCDRYVSSTNKNASPMSLSTIFARGRNHKARALHYFPPKPSEGPQQQQGVQSEQQGVGHLGQQGQSAGEHEEVWCGWHTDHGSLTGLTCAMYVGPGGGDVGSPDPTSGLYIRTRTGEVVQGSIPPAHIAYQVGEAMQVHSGGVLRATPHYVRAPRGTAAAGVARNTFAVFMQPDVFEPMAPPEGASDADVEIGTWQRGQTFDDFSRATFEKYYGRSMM